MKQIVDLKFNNGLFAIDTHNLPVKVRAIEKAEHGDWKTQLVRNEFMGLKKDEEGELIKVWDNFYGRWCRVRRKDGKTCDVEANQLDCLLMEGV
jgi:hypothetical protein